MTRHPAWLGETEIVERLRERAGWALPESRRRDLARAVAAVPDLAEERGLDLVIERLSVGETYFHRDGAFLRALAAIMLPEIMIAHGGSARSVAIWSAGCATGEEAYTLAAVVREVVGGAVPGWRPVLGTDLNAAFLERAREGIYGKNSFRGVDPGNRRRFAGDAGHGRWRVVDEVQAMVRFARHNLARDPYPVECDLIVCQNVLMYLDPACARRVIEGFGRSLRPGGWLVVGASETMLVETPTLHPVRLQGRTYHRREPSHAVCEASPAPAVPRARRSPPSRTSPAVDARAVARHARGLADVGELDAAAAACARALAIDGGDARLHYLAATIEEARGDGERALASLHRALYLEPEFAMAQFAAGVVSRSIGREPAAAAHLRAALSIATRMDPTAAIVEGDGLDAAGLARMVAMALDGRR